MLTIVFDSSSSSSSSCSSSIEREGEGRTSCDMYIRSPADLAIAFRVRQGILTRPDLLKLLAQSDAPHHPAKSHLYPHPASRSNNAHLSPSISPNPSLCLHQPLSKSSSSKGLNDEEVAPPVVVLVVKGGPEALLTLSLKFPFPAPPAPAAACPAFP